MEEIKERVLYLTLDKEDYRKGFLELLNGVAKLTKREREVFLSFCELTDERDIVNILDPTNRAIVSSKLRLSLPNLNNTISELKRKNAMIFDEEHSVYYLNPLMVPSTKIAQIRYIITYR